MYIRVSALLLLPPLFVFIMNPFSEKSAGKPDIHVRFYEEKDAEAVRALFVSGVMHGEDCAFEVGQRYLMREHIVLPAYALLGLGLAAMLPKESPVCFVGQKTLSAVLCATAIAWVAFWRWRLALNFQAYCDHSLSSDLADIPQYYAPLKSKDTGDDDGGVSGFWVAEAVSSDGAKQVVGCVGLDSRTQKDKSRCELRRMYVSDDFRRRGIAGKLINTLIAHARERGVGMIVLSTTTYQELARMMYQRLGWVEVGQIPRLVWFMRSLQLHMLERAI
ncbi:acyl-CoA N-acyltransferase [Ephemerocybe angulata]|uniref:Acyl-CoA N-acyltransferase n=1 Tax=Ephemerocybe angulata TaxID=980116 RepID=A0A8H6MB26_9AGAR|nr:acyl-CoA N-acyltransferase [Tulosesus angulatus]